MALREILALLDVKVDSSQLDKADAKLGQFVGGIRNTIGVLAGAAFVSATKGFIADMVASGDAVTDTAAQLDIGTDELQKWGYAAQQSGSSAEKFGVAINVLQKNLAAATEAGSEQGKLFKELGVAVQDSEGRIRPSTEVFREVGLSIAGLPDQAKKADAAMKIFGKAGKELLPIFAEGEEGLESLFADFDRFGGGWSGDALSNIAQMGDAVDRFEFSTLALKSTLAVQVLPSLTRWLDTLSLSVVGLSKNEKFVAGLQGAFIGLAAIGVAAAATMIAPYLPLALVLAAILIIVQDLYTAFTGGESLIGRVLDKLLGKGAAKSIFKDIKRDWDDFVKSVEGKPIPEIIEAAFTRIGASVGRFISEDLPELYNVLSDKVGSGSAEAGEVVALSLMQAFIGFPATLAIEAKKAIDAWWASLSKETKAKINDAKALFSEFGAAATEGMFPTVVPEGATVTRSPTATGKTPFLKAAGGLLGGLPVLLLSNNTGGGRNVSASTRIDHLEIHPGSRASDVRQGINQASDENLSALEALETIA